MWVFSKKKIKNDPTSYEKSFRVIFVILKSVEITTILLNKIWFYKFLSVVEKFSFCNPFSYSLTSALES